MGCACAHMPRSQTTPQERPATSTSHLIGLHIRQHWPSDGRQVWCHIVFRKKQRNIYKIWMFEMQHGVVRLYFLQSIPYTIAIFDNCPTLCWKQENTNCKYCNYTITSSMLQCYCGKIQQMLTFYTSVYCPKACNRSNYSVCIVKHKKNLNPTSLPGPKATAVFRLQTLVSIISL
jgi:hypothetical protein